MKKVSSAAARIARLPLQTQAHSQTQQTVLAIVNSAPSAPSPPAFVAGAKYGESDSAAVQPKQTDRNGWDEWRRLCSQEVDALREQMYKAADVVTRGVVGEGQGGRRLG